jgi:hypothetical protein
VNGRPIKIYDTQLFGLSLSLGGGEDFWPKYWVQHCGGSTPWTRPVLVLGGVLANTSFGSGLLHAECWVGPHFGLKSG